MKRQAIDTSRFFQGIHQVEHPDYDVKLPIFYYDCSAMTAIYTASTAAVRAQLPSDDMHPVELWPGRCLVAFSGFTYRRTDIGPYNEFSIGALITRGHRSLPGLGTLASALRNDYEAYVLQLPVTSERACRGGVEMAGYPKFIADIDWKNENGTVTCTVSQQGNLLIRLTGQALPTSTGPLTRYVIHTRRQDVPLSANLYLNPKRFRQTLGHGKARLDTGTGHALCTQVNALDLSGEPVLYQYMPDYEAMLFGSKNLIDD